MLNDSLIAYRAIFQADANNAVFLASKAIAIITEFENALKSSKINYKPFYKILNYNYTFLGKSTFKITEINDDNLIIYLKFNTFLNQLKIHKTETAPEVIKFINFLIEYQQNSLAPGLLKYKNNLLLIQDPALLKNRLQQFMIDINKLSQFEITKHRQKKLNQMDKKYSVSEFLGVDLTETAKNAYINSYLNKNQNDEFKFIHQLKYLIDKKDINYRDIAQLKTTSNQFESSILKLDSINEIIRFYWLVNLICNFLNIFSNCFESNKSLEIKHQFEFWHQCLTTSENNVDLVEKNILNIK